jgi:hypothetical protein
MWASKEEARQYLLETPDFEPWAGTAMPPIERNVLTHDGVRVEVATVHRVKGETHTATLFVNAL